MEWPSPFAAEVKRRACERRTNGRHLRVCKRPYGDADRHRRRYQSEPRWSARYEGQCPGPRHSATAPSPLHWAGRSDRHQPPFYIRSQHEHDTIHGSRSPALPQMQPTPEQRAERPRCQTTGDWLLFCTPRSVSVDTACITTHAYHPPITNTHPNNINTWHATPHHTTHRTPHMTPPTHTPPHTPHTLSLPPSPLRHSPLVAHHPPANTTPLPPDLTYMYQSRHVRRYCSRYSRPNHSPRVHVLGPVAMGTRLATVTASSASAFELYPLTPTLAPTHSTTA